MHLNAIGPFFSLYDLGGRVKFPVARVPCPEYTTPIFPRVPPSELHTPHPCASLVSRGVYKCPMVYIFACFWLSLSFFVRFLLRFYCFYKKSHARPAQGRPLGEACEIYGSKAGGVHGQQPGAAR